MTRMTGINGMTGMFEMIAITWRTGMTRMAGITELTGVTRMTTMTWTIQMTGMTGKPGGLE